MTTTEERKANRKKWVEALRSGAYKQTTGCLSDRGRFCCLGVAVDVCVNDEIKLNHNGKSFNGTLMGNSITSDSLGLRSSSGGFYVEGEHSSLVYINDNGLSFSEIADIIESEPEGLFID